MKRTRAAKSGNFANRLSANGLRLPRPFAVRLPVPDSWQMPTIGQHEIACSAGAMCKSKKVRACSVVI
jgi:hypothetical protein